MIFMPAAKLAGTEDENAHEQQRDCAEHEKGRNLPEPVIVRSTSRSAKAFHSRTTRNTEPAAAAQMPAYRCSSRAGVRCSG